MSTFIFSVNLLFSADRICENVILDDRIGLYLDGSENESLGIFDLDSFVRARFFRTSQDSLFAWIYYMNNSRIDSCLRYITPFEEFLIKTRLKRYGGCAKSKSNLQPVLEVDQQIFPELAEIHVFMNNSSRLDCRYVSFKQDYFKVLVADSDVVKVYLENISKIVYFNPEVEYRLLRRNFIVISSLLSMVVFDKVAQGFGYKFANEYVVRSAGLLFGFYVSYKLYRVVDHNFFKKEVYLVDETGSVFKKDNFLRRMVNSISRKIEACRKLEFY